MWLDADTQNEFWNFSFEQIAVFDLQTAVNFILSERKNNKKIIVIGQS